MFETTLAVPVRGNRAAATMFGFVTQSVLLTAAVMVPMLFPDTLPHVQNVVNIFTPGAPPPPPPPPGPTVDRVPTRVRPFQLRNNILTEPTRVPLKAQIIEEEPMTTAEMGGGGVIGGVVGGQIGGVIGGVLHSITAAAPPVRPPAPPAVKVEPAAAPKAAVAPKAPVPVGGKVQEAKLIHRVIPAYPPLAKQARVSGVVQLTGWIAANGRIRELTVVSGHPLLVRAAVEAVSQWVYQPTLLNGETVEVVAPISVHFILN